MPTVHAGDVVRIRDERWIVCRHVTHGDAAVIEVRGDDRDNRGVRARFMLPFEPIDRLPQVRTTRVVSAGRWRRLAGQVLAGATPACDSLRSLTSARIELHPFQLEPALAMVRGMAARILLADAVGLGKTIQAGLIVAETLARTPEAHVLVVCPASLREQWARELEQRFALTPALIDSTALARPSLRTAPGANPWLAHPLVIASVDFVKRAEVLRGLESGIWDVVVIDEAHGLAGRSDRHAAATLLAERARTVVLLTATPHSGNEENFRRLCGIGELHPRFPLAVFHRTRQDVGLASARRTAWLDVALTPAERRMHDALASYTRLVWRQRGGPSTGARLATLVLLRRASGRAGSLARSVERRLHFLTVAGDGADVTQLTLPFDGPEADDEEPGRELAAPGLQDGVTERARLQEILDLARLAAAAESKVRAIRRFLTRGGESAIVFTEYRDTLATLTALLGDFDCAELHGGCTAGERQLVLERFIAGRIRVLLATDAASEGLNLHHRCRLVIHLEVPWSPVRAEQRVGRVDRIGQPRRVHQLHLIAAGTSEQSIVAPLVRRRAARARDTMDALRSPAHAAHEIEHELFASEPDPLSTHGRTPPLPDGVVAMNLHVTAIEEAARAAVARRNADTVHLDPVPIRPFGTVLHRASSHGIWAFRVRVTASGDEEVWDTILGVTYAIGRQRERVGRRSAHFDAARERLLPLAGTHCAALAERTASALRQPLALGLAREQAIVAALDVRQARLAASLVQPALFDRRAERASAAQEEVLHDAVARCRAHLARLSRML